MGALTPPVVILARPQLGENIGAAARAMKNCGLTDLRLVDPRDGWPNPAALPMAAAGKDIIESAKVYKTLGDALHDVTFLVATSARPRDMAKPVSDPRSVAPLLVGHHEQFTYSGRYAGLLFGAERSGLDNDELALADIIVQADLNPEATSLNLAQAVFLMAWEWRVAALHHIAAAKPVETVSSKTMSPKMPTDSEIIPATGAARDFFFTRLEKILDERHFFGSPEMAPVVKRNLRAYFTRGTPTEQELNTLHGILTLFEQGKGLG